MQNRPQSVAAQPAKQKQKIHVDSTQHAEEKVDQNVAKTKKKYFKKIFILTFTRFTGCRHLEAGLS